MNIKEHKGLEIFLGFKCNINCVFCYQKDQRLYYRKNIESKKICNTLINGYHSGKRFVIFSGGEPTLDRNLGLYISIAKKLRYNHIRVHTNGYGFKDYDYVLNLYSKGLTGVTISIHGFGEIHNKIVSNKYGFKIIEKALVNLEKLKRNKCNDFIIDVNTVICRYNYNTLHLLVAFLSYFSITRLQIVYPYSLDLFNTEEKKDFMLSYTTLKPYMENLLDYSKKKGVNVVIENFPLCILGKDYWNYSFTNIKINISATYADGSKDGDLNIKNVYRGASCMNCMEYKNCNGIPRDYYSIYGEDEFITISK